MMKFADSLRRKHDSCWRVLVTLSSFLGYITSADVTSARLNKLLESYEVTQNPTDSKNASDRTPVHTEVTLSDIGLRSHDMVMTLEMEWTLTWSDPRLSAVAQDSDAAREIPPRYYSPSSPPLGASGPGPQLWHPDVYVANARRIHLVDFPVRQHRLTIDKDGVLRQHMRVRAELSCPAFSSHPRSLNCPIYFRAYGEHSQKVDLRWSKNRPVSLEPGVSVPLYTLTEIISGGCRDAGGVDNAEKAACAVSTLVFRPAVNFFGSEIYGASFLLVAISWVGFWIDGRHMPVRLALGLGVVLVLVVYGIGFRVINLKVGVPGNVEVWVAFCIMLVLASVIEFVFVHIFMTAFSAYRSRKQTAVNKETRLGEEETAAIESVGKLADFIDTICGVIFPVIFICFNIIYWIAY